jgi:putative glutamine amidotransferase
MVTVAVTSSSLCNARPYTQVLESLGTQVRLFTPKDNGPSEVLMEGVGALLLPGGPDIDPALYGATPDPQAGLEVCHPLDVLELRLLHYALDHDMPVLAICRGMQLLNVAFGGQLIQDLPGHRAEPPTVPPSQGGIQGAHAQGGIQEGHGRCASENHLIYLSPGSKSAAILGTGGFLRVNSRHHQGLREAQRSPRLMTSAYGVDDGLVEGLESPEHSWVIGFQCHPERQDEVPRVFTNLFAAFCERAAMYLEAAGLTEAQQGATNLW